MSKQSKFTATFTYGKKETTCRDNNLKNCQILISNVSYLLITYLKFKKALYVDKIKFIISRLQLTAIFHKGVAVDKTCRISEAGLDLNFVKIYSS